MFLSDNDRTQLEGVLGCKSTDLDHRLGLISEAAIEEYIDMFLGRKVFTRGLDIREYRLLLLIRRYFGGTLPTEQQISDLFQTSTTQSRALLRSVMAKFQYELRESIDSTLKAVVLGAKRDDEKGPYSISIDSENVIDALNRRATALDPRLPPIVRARSTTATYEIAESTYNKLKEQLSE